MLLMKRKLFCKMIDVCFTVLHVSCEASDERMNEDFPPDGITLWFLWCSEWLLGGCKEVTSGC